ncbi:hypothetical protein J4218_02165 [Candidatus Pacearchaeota archaeon]|nr:hypothetical protein [uncultured archaeon]AQS29159.1 hypothetical protein [uncultured archaeon]MBS3078903.1 hypothetical protein [Candidatus Pacearchaeota archaeon]
MTSKKQFFREATKGEIKGKTFVDFAELGGLEIVGSLDDEEYTIVREFVPRGYESARKFMKHGPEVKPRRIYSLDQAVRLGNTPVQLREEVFNSIAGNNYCSYSFVPIGKDSRKRKVGLVECLEGARLFGYAHQMGVGIKVKPYADAKRVRIDGAEVVVDVPSRTKDERRMRFKLTSVPFVDSWEKYIVSLNIGSDHSCPSKRFNIRYRYTDDKESSGVVNICAHEIAGYLQLVQYAMQEYKNLIPLQMSQFAIPSQETVDYYLRWCNNVLIKDEALESKDKLRKPNRAEREIALWQLVKSLGHDRTFYADRSRDGNVKDYNWGVK